MCLNSTKEPPLHNAGYHNVMFNKNMKLITSIIFIVMVVFNSAVACEFLDDYVEAKLTLVEASENIYNECIDSVSKAKYYFRFVQCLEREDGKNMGGGCSHLVGAGRIYGYDELPINDGYCEALKPSSEFILELLESDVRKGHIKKCK